MNEEEQRSCGYEHCQRPLETKPGHRRKEYCNDKCRQAAHRLRIEREQGTKKASLDYYLTKYHSPRLRTILERTLKEQGASDLLRLVVAIDEECQYVQGSDAMQARVTYLQMQLSEYRAVVDLDDREKIGQQFMAVGQLLNYRAIDMYHIGEGIEQWKDYRSWTYETTLAEVIIAGRAMVDEEIASRERVNEKSRLRQVERELAAVQAKKDEATTTHMQLIRDYQTYVNSSSYLHGDWKGKQAALDMRVHELLSEAIMIPTQEHCRAELVAAQSQISVLQRELAKYLPPPRELVECSLRRWSTLTNLFAQGKKLIGRDLDAFIRQASDQLLVKELEIAQACYFTEKHHQRRIAIIQQQLSDVESYRGDPALSLVSMDDQGYVTFATGDRKWMDVDDIRGFWARIVGKQGQRSVGTTNVAVIQQYLCDHPGECVEIQQGNKTVRIVMLDDDGMAVTETLQPIRLDEQDIEQARRWVQQHTQMVALS